ncbi:MAG: hypothetical protein ACRDT5_14840, partial [Mycobacterium sp.]
MGVQFLKRRGVLSANHARQTSSIHSGCWSGAVCMSNVSIIVPPSQAGERFIRRRDRRSQIHQ